MQQRNGLLSIGTTVGLVVLLLLIAGSIPMPAAKPANELSDVAPASSNSALAVVVDLKESQLLTGNWTTIWVNLTGLKSDNNYTLELEIGQQGGNYLHSDSHELGFVSWSAQKETFHWRPDEEGIYNVSAVLKGEGGNTPHSQFDSLKTISVSASHNATNATVSSTFPRDVYTDDEDPIASIVVHDPQNGENYLLNMSVWQVQTGLKEFGMSVTNLDWSPTLTDLDVGNYELLVELWLKEGNSDGSDQLISEDRAPFSIIPEQGSISVDPGWVQFDSSLCQGVSPADQWGVVFELYAKSPWVSAAETGPVIVRRNAWVDTQTSDIVFNLLNPGEYMLHAYSFCSDSHPNMDNWYQQSSASDSANWTSITVTSGLRTNVTFTLWTDVDTGSPGSAELDLQVSWNYGGMDSSTVGIDFDFDAAGNASMHRSPDDYTLRAACSSASNSELNLRIETGSVWKTQNGSDVVLEYGFSISDGSESDLQFVISCTSGDEGLMRNITIIPVDENLTGSEYESDTKIPGFTAGVGLVSVLVAAAAVIQRKVRRR